MAASDYNQDLDPGLSTGLGKAVAQSFHQAPTGPLDGWPGILIAAIMIAAIITIVQAAARR